MPGYILSDKHHWTRFLPFTYTRSLADCRLGILTLKEKWEKYLKTEVFCFTTEYLQPKYPFVKQDIFVIIDAAVIPDSNLAAAINRLDKGESLVKNGIEIACAFQSSEAKEGNHDFTRYEYEGEVQMLRGIWDFFSLNAAEIKKDFELLTHGRKSEPIPEGVQVVNEKQVFIEEGAKVLFSTLNASEGPIYIGKDAEIMEGCMVRGPFALCEHSSLKMGAKIYSGTTIGPHSKVGGEVNNSIIFGYSNKGHDGFLGNSVIGEWCNLGADTNNSNLKNNYDEVKIWSFEKNGFVKTGLQFCGLFMGDHSKCGINTMFNTGTVVGVSANIFGSGFPRNFIPSFSWGGASGFSIYKFEKAMETAALMMKRRGLEINEVDLHILHHVFELSENYRKNLE